MSCSLIKLHPCRNQSCTSHGAVSSAAISSCTVALTSLLLEGELGSCVNSATYLFSSERTFPSMEGSQTLPVFLLTLFSSELLLVLWTRGTGEFWLSLFQSAPILLWLWWLTRSHSALYLCDFLRQSEDISTSCIFRPQETYARDKSEVRE